MVTTTKPNELGDVKERLRQKLKELEYNIQRQRECLGDEQLKNERAKDPDGALDYAGPVAEAVLIRNSKQIRDVLDALANSKSERYGICGECGEPIAIGRLKVTPWARCCVHCQDKIEQFERAAR